MDWHVDRRPGLVSRRRLVADAGNRRHRQGGSPRTGLCADRGLDPALAGSGDADDRRPQPGTSGASAGSRARRARRATDRRRPPSRPASSCGCFDARRRSPAPATTRTLAIDAGQCRSRHRAVRRAAGRARRLRVRRRLERAGIRPRRPATCGAGRAIGPSSASGPKGTRLALTLRGEHRGGVDVARRRSGPATASSRSSTSAGPSRGPSSFPQRFFGDGERCDHDRERAHGTCRPRQPWRSADRRQLGLKLFECRLTPAS